MLYSFYVISLSIFLYWMPALAWYPQALRTPVYASVLPILNVALVGVLTTIFLIFGIFTPLVVRIAIAMLTIVAAFRIHALWQKGPPQWTTAAKEGWLLNLLLVLPYAVHLGTTAFDSDDEIYSWNYWALQYVQGYIQAEFVHNTGVPYPQFFPKWLAFAYQWLGNTQLQLPLRATLAWFPFCTLQAITLLARENYRAIWLTRIGLVIVLYGTNVQRYFEIGYADPLMIASLITSVALYLHYLQRQQRTALWLSVICAITAVYTKQPGLYWAAIAMPLCLWRCATPQTTILHWKAVGGLWTAVALWWLFEGRGFMDNSGVLQASFAGRGWFEQAQFAIKKYLIHQPIFLFTGIASAWSVYRISIYRPLWMAWFLPSTLLWFFFGAYHLRLGVHNILGAFLFCVAANFPWIREGLPWIEKLQAHRKRIFMIIAIIIFSVAGHLWHRADLRHQGAPNPYHSGEIALRKYFGNDWPWVYAHLYQQPVVIWCTTDYIYGLFYTQTSILRPEFIRYVDIEDEKTLEKIVLTELREKAPDYVITQGSHPAQGLRLSQAVERLALQYPGELMAMRSGKNRYGYTIYQFQKK